MFRRMITHRIVVGAHYLLLILWAILTVAGTIWFATEGKNRELAFLAVGFLAGTPILWIVTRVFSELVVVLFSVNERLENIRKSTRTIVAKVGKKESS